MVSLTFRSLSQLLPIENNIGWAPDPVSAFWRREKSLASTWNRIPDISAHILVTRRLNSLLGLLDHWRLKALPSSETSENHSTAISGNNTQPWRNSRKPSPQKLWTCSSTYGFKATNKYGSWFEQIRKLPIINRRQIKLNLCEVFARF